MKKSLLAVAAMTAFAGAAQAQSSVTVYGLLDMGYQGGKTTTTNSSGVKTQTNYSAFNANNLNTSRLGFKGTEDLGGGSSAFFTVEMGLNPEDANFSGAPVAQDAYNKSMTNGGSTVDNRQSFAGLKKNGIGQFAFGRQYTVIFQEAAKTDTSQLANIVGNVIYQGSTKVGAGTYTGYGYGESFTNRTSNTLTVGSDTFAGFQANAFYALNNATKTTDTGSTASGFGISNYNGYGLNANYTWNKLYATVSYQSIKTQLDNAYTSATTTTNINNGGPLAPVVIGAATATTIPAIMLSDKQTYAAATYDFGILKAYAQWIGRKIQNDTTVAASSLYAGSQLNRTAQQIGVRSYVTPTIEAYASIGNGKITGPMAATGAPASLSFVGYQVGSNYWLSKRTNLYAIYGQNQTSQSTTVTGGGSSANQYAVGVRHTF